MPPPSASLAIIALWALTAPCVFAQPPLVQLDAFGDNSIRVRVAPASGAITDPPLQALLQGGERPVTRTRVTVAAPNDLTNGNLRVAVDAATGFLTATRVSDSAVLLRQTALVWGVPDVPVSREGSVSVAATFAGTANEKIYGLGEHRTGLVNQMPYTKRFADSQDYGQSHGSDVSIPWYSSSLGYGFLWNSAGYGSATLTESSLTWTTNATLGLDLWITTTSDSFDPATGRSPYADLLSQYVDAVGHASLMPFYSTGFIQCKDRYRNQSQLLDVARGYVERQLPISVIVIDWHHWTAQGDWHLNPLCWPAPQSMFDELQEMGIELMITFWPFQSKESRHWQEFSSSGYLVNLINATEPTSYDGGDQFLVDQTNPATRNAVFEGFWEGYGSLGVKTIWIDAAEPEHFGADNEGKWKYLLGTDAEVGEAFIQQHALSFAEGFATKGITPDDYFILPRHAWVGSWRHSAALWSGDIVSTFDELALQVKALQGALMSGVSLWTTDIGGYHSGNPDDPVFQELIVRWFQFGAFCPLFRLHGHRDGGPASDECGETNGDNEVWNLAKDAAHYDSIVSVMRLREGLRQYVAAANAEAAATGMPMARPMFLAFPLDAECQSAQAEDQFMFGRDWLVAPVTTMGATTRSVYLPALNASSEEWVYYYNFSSVGAGGARVDVPTTISDFPLFFRRPLTPPTPPAFANATLLWSAERNDTALCVAQQCYSDNAPQQDGAYAPLSVEGVALADGETHAAVNGVDYATVPLYLFYSAQHEDNIVSTSHTPPDATYEISFPGGAAFATPPPGALQLQYWFKAWAGADWDYATVATPEGLAWVQQRGYKNVTDAFAVRAWVLPVA